MKKNTMEAVLDVLEKEDIQNLAFENVIDDFMANREQLSKVLEEQLVEQVRLTICLEISSYERNLIRYRMKAGYEDYLKRRKDNPNLRLGRQGYEKDEKSYREDYKEELTLLRKGISLRNIQKLTGTSIGTLQKIKKFV